MSKSTHTPEEWRLLTPVIMPENGHHIIAATDRSSGRDFPIAHVFHFGDKPDESDANARLIEAGPLMLSALRSARDVLARLEGEVIGYGVEDALRQASRAISAFDPHEEKRGATRI